jgi:hypothetical protein
MKFGKRLAILAVSSVTLSAMSANAQMWGTGVMMGQQSCPYNVSAGDGASSYLDEYNEVKKAKSEEEAKLREMKRKLRNLEKSLDKEREAIEDTIDSRYTSDLIAHMDGTHTCQDYDYDEITPTKTNTTVDQDGEPVMPSADAPQVGAQTGMTKLTGFSPKQWRGVCQAGKGVVNTAICTTTGFASSDRGKYSPNDCKKALTSYRKDTVDYQKTQTDIERSEDRIANYKEQLPELMRDAKQRYKEDRQAGTEGDVCLTCIAGGSGYVSERQSPDWAGVAANVGVGLAAMYMGYQQNKMVAQYNSNLGWPTQSYPTWGYGLPFLANGLYGALGGGIGAGGFGCAGGIGGGGFGTGYMGGMGPFGLGGGLYGNAGIGGAFGYPNGMMGSPFGGGMYAGGMGPWGMGGMGGMGYPGMGGMMMSGGLMANGGMMSPYGMMGMMNPYGSMGMMGMMSPYGMMANAGIMANAGMMGMMSPYGMMANAGMMGMMNPYGSMGMMGMMSPYGMMANGGIGLMMNGGMMNPYGMMGMGTMMDGGLGSMQMQQAMMQMQQQQMQLYMQQYQQQMQNQMARQQTMSGLQSELYNLMYRIQQVQYGYGSYGTSLGIGGSYTLGGGFGYGTGNPSVPIPAPGNGVNTGTGVLPATGTGGSVVIPAGSR